MAALRPYAPNARPQPYPIAAGSARLLERIWQPHCAWMPHPAAWGVAPEREAVAARQRCGRLLDVFGCDHVNSYPDAHSEVVRFQDRVRHVVEDGGNLTADPVTYEVARFEVPQYGIAKLEQVDTWARLTPLDPQTGDPVGNPRELLGDAIAAENAGIDTWGTPFPFPLQHPTLPGATLSLGYMLGHYRTPPGRQGTPRMFGPAGWSTLPRDHTVLQWADSRYVWGSDGSRGLAFIFGGYGLLRLFCGIRCEVTGSWRVELAGRLTGFRQQAGKRAAALENATRRG